METARETANRVVARLLGEDYASPEEFNKRPGGKDDPLRQTTMKLGLKKKDFTGKRPAAAGNVAAPQGKVEKKHPRFGLKFEGKAGGVPKAFKQGKKAKGKSVAGKPGKVSYRESLMRSVLEKLAVKKAMKMGKKASGNMVAGKPGKVSYKGESARVEEKLGAKSGIKGGKAKKMLNSIAKGPGKVGYGKK